MACNGDIQPEVKQGSSSYKGLGCNQQTTGRSEAALARSPQILQISHTNIIPKGILPYFTCHFCLAKSPCAVDKNMSQPRWPHCPKSKHVQHDKTLFTISCIYIYDIQTYIYIYIWYDIMGLSKNGGIPIICSPGKSLVSSGNISSCISVDMSSMTMVLIDIPWEVAEIPTIYQSIYLSIYLSNLI